MIFVDGFQERTSWIFMNLQRSRLPTMVVLLKLKEKAFLSRLQKLLKQSWGKNTQAFLIVMALYQTKGKCHFPVDNLKFCPETHHIWKTWCPPPLKYSSGQWTAYLPTKANASVTLGTPALLIWHPAHDTAPPLVAPMISTMQATGIFLKIAYINGARL